MIGIRLAIAALLLLVVAAPASAAAPPDGAYARFGMSNGTAGVAIVDYIDDDELQLTAAFVGFQPDRQHRIVGRSIGCNGTPSSANRIFGAVLRTDAYGGLFGDSFLTSDPAGPTWAATRSLWIDLRHPVSGDALSRCALTVNFDELEVAAGDVDVDGAVGLLATTFGRGVILVERRSQGRARVTVSLRRPNDDVIDTIVTLRDAKCETRGSALAKIAVSDVGSNAFASRTVDLTQAELDELQSFRIANATEGTRLGCAPAQPFSERTP